MKWLQILFLTTVLGCSHFSQRSAGEENTNASAMERASEDSELLNAEKVLALGRIEQARVLFKDFSGRKPVSRFYQSAKLGEAQALYGLGQFQQAADLYREIYLKTLNEQPNIAGLALYYMSFAYEALGDDQKTVAALLDTKNFADSMPPEIALAEVPARLAAAYARQGREQEAMAYLNQADKGIGKVIASKGPKVKNDWLAKTYFQMGSVSTNQLTRENFSDFIQGQRGVQVYLIKSLKLADEVWSQKSLDKLCEIYRDLYHQVESAPLRTEQNRLGGELLDLLDQADLYRPLQSAEATKYELDFFAFIQDVRKKVGGVVYSGEGTMPLTEESQRLNGLKRIFPFSKESSLPEPAKSTIPLPPKVVPTEDPNL